MISLVLLQLLAVDPAETYGELGVEKLLEKKRALMEERGTFAAPTVTVLAGFAVLGSGGAVLASAFTGNNRGCDRYGSGESLCIGGGVATAVGAAVLTLGLVWLLKRVEAWSAITARIIEIDGLVAYKSTRPLQP